MSSWPKCSTAVSTSCSIERTSSASNATPIAASPSSSASRSAASALMSPIATRAPSAASRRALAAPIPDAPPVTMATLPSRRRQVNAASVNLSRLGTFGHRDPAHGDDPSAVHSPEVVRVATDAADGEGGIEPDPVAVPVCAVAVDGHRRVHVEVATRRPQVLLHVVQKLRSALGDVTHLEADVFREEFRQPI